MHGCSGNQCLWPRGLQSQVISVTVSTVTLEPKYPAKLHLHSGCTERAGQRRFKSLDFEVIFFLLVIYNRL